jgi:cytoplasmic tRNA 2-thiolation protein 1
MTGASDELPRVKPFKRSYQKEIVMYAYHKKLDYFATECTYSPEAYRGNAREFVKDLEVEHPISILQAIISGDTLRRTSEVGPSTGKGAPQVRKRCIRCGYMTSQKVCKACVLLEGLNTGDAELGVRKRGGKVAAGEVPLQAKAPRGPIVLEYERT